jgi:hypothetical protein
MADLTLYGFRLSAYRLSRQRVELTVEVLLKGPPELVIDTLSFNLSLAQGRQAALGEVKREVRRVVQVHADETPWFEQQLGIVRDL